MSSMVLNLDAAIRLLGDGVVFIPNVNRTKMPAITGWKDVTFEKSLTQEYQSRLKAAGGASVLMGKPSGGLISIDADSDEALAEVLSANPAFAMTLITRGERGGNIWLRIDGDYPGYTPLLTRSGKPWGEFRSTGVKTTIFGIHPSGRPYVALNPVQPLVVPFSAIVWPDSVTWPTPTTPRPVAVPSPISTAAGTEYDDLVSAEGEPYKWQKSTLHLNDSFFAGRFCREHNVLFEPTENQFYLYDTMSGLWVEATQARLCQVLSDDLKFYADAAGVPEIAFLRDNGTLNGIANLVKGKSEKRDAFSGRRCIHAKNGMLHLSEGKAVLHAFSPSHYSRNLIPHNYDPSADCPQFINKLLRPALDSEDISLLQRWAGSVLLGGNEAQRFLILMGTAAGGKSTLIRIIESIVGLANVAQLRTDKLGERFEQSRFLGKLLLCGKDVAGDFLQQESAYHLKALVGHDVLTPELKGSNATPLMLGDFAVAITCNSKLMLRLDHDIEAYRRRLLVIEYDKPKVAKADGKFAEKLLKAEGSGILRWMVEGALIHLAELEVHGNYILTTKQQQRIDSLLAESDSVNEFAKNALVKTPEATITVTELYQHYVKYCERMEWEGLSERCFQNRIATAIKDSLHEVRRNDIQRAGKAQRGFKNIEVRR